MGLNLIKVINQALLNLNPRQREVIQLRYGLKNNKPLTLAAVGNKYDVTRERVRQIEARALKTLTAQFATAEFDDFKKAATDYLASYQGVRRHDYAVTDLKQPKTVIQCVLEVSGVARFYPEDNNIHAFWCLSHNDMQRAFAAINTLIAQLRATKQAGETPTDPILQNYIAISKKFSVSPYGKFGLAEWREINPRVSRDWAYLVLQQENQPLHFLKIATGINKLRGKKVNPQTIHNELIKDKRFILVGRGMYGLQSFDIIPGTAREVLTHFLKKHGPLPAKNLIQLAMAARPFKEKTLFINLQNKTYFKRVDEGKYFVRKA